MYDVFVLVLFHLIRKKFGSSPSAKSAKNLKVGHPRNLSSFKYAEFDGNVHGNVHLTGKTFFWANLVQIKTPFEMKVCTWTNLNMLNSVVMLIYPALDGNTLSGEIQSK